jgi:hypothetical protein
MFKYSVVTSSFIFCGRACHCGHSSSEVPRLGGLGKGHGALILLCSTGKLVDFDPTEDKDWRFEGSDFLERRSRQHVGLVVNFFWPE